MGQKGSREAQEETRAQDREEEAPRPRQSIREKCYQIQTNGATTWVAPEPPPPPPPRPVLEIYARYLAVNPLRPLHLCLPKDMALAERRRITGLEEDPQPAISWLHVGYREKEYEQRGVVEVTRSTTLGALSQMRLWDCLDQELTKPFIHSAAASVTIDELGDYSDPETGLEHHIEDCASDEEKMAMRVAVFRGLHLIFALLERAELHGRCCRAGSASSERSPRVGSTREGHVHLRGRSGFAHLSERFARMPRAGQGVVI